MCKERFTCQFDSAKVDGKPFDHSAIKHISELCQANCLSLLEFICI